MKDKNKFSKKIQGILLWIKNKGLFFKYGLNVKQQIKTKKEPEYMSEKIYIKCATVGQISWIYVGHIERLDISKEEVKYTLNYELNL